MKTNKPALLLAAVLLLTGCDLRETEVDKPVPQETQRETESEKTVDSEAPDMPVYAENPTVSAAYGHEYSGEYDSYTVDDWEYAMDVVFTTDGAVRDFKVLALTLDEITDEGGVSFLFDELYVHGELTPDRGLAVKMSLPETIPYYGISYTDGNGITRIFSVNVSGFDGSVQLVEIGGAG